MNCLHADRSVQLSFPNPRRWDGLMRIKADIRMPKISLEFCPTQPKRKMSKQAHGISGTWAQGPAVSQNARHGTIPVLDLSGQETTFSPEINNRGRTAGSSKSPGRTGLFLTAVLFLLGFAFLGSRFQMAAHGSQGKEVTAGAKVAELSRDSSAIPKTPSVDPGLPLDQIVFVLQVGAMTHEENAAALAASLRQRNFPVIVSQSGTSRFYRVVVGPYGDVDSTLRVQEQLKKQGFDAFRTMESFSSVGALSRF